MDGNAMGGKAAVREAKFRVGDRVRYRDDKVNGIGTLRFIDGNSYYVEVAEADRYCAYFDRYGNEFGINRTCRIFYVNGLEPALTIVPGRYYRTRMGDVVGPVERDDIGLSAVVGGKIRLYNSAGEHLFGDATLDLVEEVEAPTLRIEAGRYYKTRDGRKVGPIRPNNGEYYHSEFMWIAGTGRDGRYAWRDDGSWSLNICAEHDSDLIAEWPAEKVDAAPHPKSGDRIRSLVDEMDVTKGSVYEVHHTSNGGVYVYDDVGDEYYLSPCEYEIVTDRPAIVARMVNGAPRPSSTPYVHGNVEAAKTEAECLAHNNPGSEFGVYELVAVHKEERTYEHEWQRLASEGKTSDARKTLQQSGLTGLQASRVVQEFLAAA